MSGKFVWEDGDIEVVKSDDDPSSNEGKVWNDLLKEWLDAGIKDE